MKQKLKVLVITSLVLLPGLCSSAWWSGLVPMLQECEVEEVVYGEEVSYVFQRCSENDVRKITVDKVNLKYRRDPVQPTKVLYSYSK